MRAAMRRKLWMLRNIFTRYHSLKDRVKVEQEMWNCVSGKQEMPDKEKLTEWAVTLGVPKEYR